MILGGGTISEFNFSKAWGVNPAAASGTVIMDAEGGGDGFGLAVGDYVTYSFGSVASFPGVVSEVSEVTEFATGRVQSFQVVDNRVRLGWQMIFAAWNIEDDIYGKGLARPTAPSTGEDTSSHGDDLVHVEGATSTFVPFINATAADAGTAPAEPWAVRRRYRHLLPEHWESGTWTYSDTPLTAKQILNSAFNHAWGDYGFTRSYHSSLSTAILTGLDYTTGIKLSNLIAEINSKTGLEICISGSRTLIWARKGVGLNPIADSSATPITTGASLTSVDTRIRVVGERIRMQVLNIELEPDWNVRYECWIDELAWLRKVAEVFGKPHTTKAEMADLAAFAREVTLDEFAKKQTSPSLLDSRPFGKISRNQLPVWVYIRELVYRSYRIPEDYVLHGVPLSSLDIADGLLCTTEIQGGEGAPEGEEGGGDANQIYANNPVEFYPPVQAQAICKGQPLDLITARDIRLFYRNTTDNLSEVWSVAPQFEVDTLGKSIRFNVPTFIDGDPASGQSIYLMHNRGEGGGTDVSGMVPSGSDFLDVAVPNPDFQITPARVKASFTFLLGRFYRDYGGGPRRGSVVASGLDMHVLDCTLDEGLDDPGVKLLDDTDIRLPDVETSLFQEVLYYDGDGAVEKADAVASSLLSLSPTQYTGGFTRHGVAGTVLSPVIDRITVSITFGDAVTERVEYTKARATSVPLAERTLQRIQRTEELFSGQDALKREIREYRLIAAQERAAKTANRARTHTTFSDVFEKPSGSEAGASTLIIDRNSIGYSAGDIVWLDDAGVPTPNGGTFGGIAVANTKGKEMYVAHSGRVPVRVTGGIAVGGLVMGTPGEKLGKAVGQFAVGRLTHGESVPEYANNMLVYLDVSVPCPSCRFRVTFDAGKQRLYVGPGMLGLIQEGETVMPIEPTLGGVGISTHAPPWWEISGQTLGVEYRVICKYSGGQATMLLISVYEPLLLNDQEIAWVVATLTFGIQVGTGKYRLDAFDQVWWSDITIEFDAILSGGPGGGSSSDWSDSSDISDSSGSDKSTAIVKAPWLRSGFTALFCLESPDVRFPDVARIPINSRLTRWAIDPRYLAVCEPGTIWASASGDTACPVGAQVIGNEVVIRTGIFRRPSHVVISLTAIRKGFLGKRFPSRSHRQFLANEATINAAYPPS